MSVKVKRSESVSVTLSLGDAGICSREPNKLSDGRVDLRVTFCSCWACSERLTCSAAVSVSKGSSAEDDLVELRFC